MISNYAAQLNAVNLRYNSVGQWTAANDARLKLANQATAFQGSPQAFISLHNQDKALELQGVQGKIFYEVALAMEEAARARQKKAADLRQQAIQNGALFG